MVRSSPSVMYTMGASGFRALPAMRKPTRHRQPGAWSRHGRIDSNGCPSRGSSSLDLCTPPWVCNRGFYFRTLVLLRPTHPLPQVTKLYKKKVLWSAPLRNKHAGTEHCRRFTAPTVTPTDHFQPNQHPSSVHHWSFTLWPGRQRHPAARSP